MKRVFLFAVVFMSACSAQFGGTYAGTVIEATTCSDGSTGNQGEQMTMVLKQSGGTVSLDSNTCPGVSGTVDGDTVNLHSTTCPSQTNNGTTVTVTYTSGTLKLDGKALTVKINANEAVVVNGQNATCTGTLSGTLALQE